MNGCYLLSVLLFTILCHRWHNLLGLVHSILVACGAYTLHWFPGDSLQCSLYILGTCGHFHCDLSCMPHILHQHISFQLRMHLYSAIQQISLALYAYHIALPNSHHSLICIQHSFLFLYQVSRIKRHKAICHKSLKNHHLHQA